MGFLVRRITDDRSRGLFALDRCMAENAALEVSGVESGKPKRY